MKERPSKEQPSDVNEKYRLASIRKMVMESADSKGAQKLLLGSFLEYVQATSKEELVNLKG